MKITVARGLIQGAIVLSSLLTATASAEEIDKTVGVLKQDSLHSRFSCPSRIVIGTILSTRLYGGNWNGPRRSGMIHRASLFLPGVNDFSVGEYLQKDSYVLTSAYDRDRNLCYFFRDRYDSQRPLKHNLILSSLIVVLGIAPMMNTSAPKSIDNRAINSAGETQ